MTCLAGGAGWYLTLNDVMNVIGTLRRKQSVLPSHDMQDLLDRSVGIDQSFSIGVSNIYVKSGFWYSFVPTEVDDLRIEMEQAIVYILPDQMELSIFVNSRVEAPDTRYLTNLVTPMMLRHFVAH